MPFVALRPGAFIGVWDFWKRGLRKGRLMAMGSASVRWTYVHVDDVARYLAMAVDQPGADGQRIDIGMDRPVSTQDLAAVFTDILGRDITVRGLPWPLLNLLARPVGMFSERVSDMRTMIEYFHTGEYVADTSALRRLSAGAASFKSVHTFVLSTMRPSRAITMSPPRVLQPTLLLPVTWALAAARSPMLTQSSRTKFWKPG